MASNPINKILILAANPLHSQLAVLRLEKEIMEIRATLERSPQRDNFTIETRGAVRPEDLQTYLFNIKPQIVHFSGHGAGEPGLAFEDEAGECNWLIRPLWWSFLSCLCGMCSVWC